MRWLKLTLAYDGRAYAGWQVQPDKPTLQASLEAVWHDITSEHVRVTAAGRTDAGVHALGQVVGLPTASHLENDELCRALNAKLPEDLAVLNIDDAPRYFHATRDAVSKTYRYQIHNDRVPPVFNRRYAWHCPQPLDTDAMHAAAQLLVGRHDFTSFEKSGSPRPDRVRTILGLGVSRGAGEQSAGIRIEVEGDGFLYNMVRTIVGTLVHVGRGAKPPGWVAEVLAARDRRRAGQTAPAHGLFLVRVNYP